MIDVDSQKRKQCKKIIIIAFLFLLLYYISFYVAIVHLNERAVILLIDRTIKTRSRILIKRIETVTESNQFKIN